MDNGFNEYRAVARLAELLAIRRGFPPAVAKQIRIAALLHDVGKMKLPVELLQKPGPLDRQEFEVIKTHTTLGAEMMGSLRGELGEMVKNTCRWHHEWENGAGYWGIKASALPPYIAIISICDVYIALIHRRVYKPAWPVNAALEYIYSQADKQFSRDLADDFISLIHDGAAVVN